LLQQIAMTHARYPACEGPTLKVDIPKNRGVKQYKTPARSGEQGSKRKRQSRVVLENLARFYGRWKMRSVRGRATSTVQTSRFKIGSSSCSWTRGPLGLGPQRATAKSDAEFLSLSQS